MNTIFSSPPPPPPHLKLCLTLTVPWTVVQCLYIPHKRYINTCTIAAHTYGKVTHHTYGIRHIHCMSLESVATAQARNRGGGGGSNEPPPPSKGQGSHLWEYGVGPSHSPAEATPSGRSTGPVRVQSRRQLFFFEWGC